MLQHLAVRVVIFLSYIALVSGDRRSIDQDATKTITTEDGDLFKCIHINQQPAFSHPLLKNHKIQMNPSSYPSGLYNGSLSATTNSLAQLPKILCPRGTIPILQGSKGDTKGFLSFHTMDAGGRGELAVVKTVDDIYGSRVSINVYEPKVKEKTEDLSTSWVLMLNNQNKSHLEAIGAGSIGGSQHDDMCFDHLCPGFVQVNPSVGLGARIRPVSVYNGPQYMIDVLLFKDLKTGDWWLAYSGKPIGYLPSSLFAHMSDKCTEAVWGGHVSGPTIQSNFSEMGSGHFASEGFGKAAFVRNIKVVDVNNKYVVPDKDKTFASSSRMTCYPVDNYGQDDGMHVYYGGPGGCNN